MLGHDPARFQETRAAWIERLHPEDRETAVAIYHDYVAGKIRRTRSSYANARNPVTGSGSSRSAKLWNGTPRGSRCECSGRTRTSPAASGQRSFAGERSHPQEYRSGCTVGIGLVSNRILKQVNDRLCDMLGYSREELIGESARIFYPSQEEFDWVGREKYQLIREFGTGTVETRWQHKDGRLVEILLSSTPLDPSDLSAGVIFTALDITERKRAEEFDPDTSESVGICRYALSRRTASEDIG